MMTVSVMTALETMTAGVTIGAMTQKLKTPATTQQRSRQSQVRSLVQLSFYKQLFTKFVSLETIVE